MDILNKMDQKDMFQVGHRINVTRCNKRAINYVKNGFLWLKIVKFM